MYIKVLKTWCGIEGMFTKDSIREVDEAVLEKIGNEKLGDNRLLYEEVPPPWEARKDEAAVKVAELQGRIGKAADELERLEDDLFKMQSQAGPGPDSLTAAVENVEHDQIEIEQRFRELEVKAARAAKNAAKHPNKANNKKAADMAAERDKAVRVGVVSVCLVARARGQLLLHNADIGETELEVADAKAELAAMRDELYELRPDLKPKVDEDGPTEKTEAPDGTGQADGKDAADAEGQTDAPGQSDGVPDEVAAG